MSAFTNASFGIDHPLLAVADLDIAAERLAALGFVVTPLGRHPWGTHNRLALLTGGLLELMTIGDPAAVDDGAVDHFLFARPVRAALAESEGIAMVALHSTDLGRDIAAAPVPMTGTIDFRRPLILPDGSPDEAVVKLAMLNDADHPRLSHFLCQQMKRGLVEVAEWRRHPNGAERLIGLTYLDDDAGNAAQRCAALWGTADGHGRYASAGGPVHVITRDQVALRFPGLSLSPTQWERRPAAIAVTVLVDNLAAARRHILAAAPGAHDLGHRLLVPADYLADTIFEFVAA